MSGDVNGYGSDAALGSLGSLILRLRNVLRHRHILRIYVLGNVLRDVLRNVLRSGCCSRSLCINLIILFLFNNLFLFFSHGLFNLGLCGNGLYSLYLFGFLFYCGKGSFEIKLSIGSNGIDLSLLCVVALLKLIVFSLLLGLELGIKNSYLIDKLSPILVDFLGVFCKLCKNCSGLIVSSAVNIFCILTSSLILGVALLVKFLMSSNSLLLSNLKLLSALSVSCKNSLESSLGAADSRLDSVVCFEICVFVDSHFVVHKIPFLRADYF